MNIRQISKLAAENQKLIDDLEILKVHQTNIDNNLTSIRNSKAFKLWRLYKQISADPKIIFKVYRYLKKYGFVGILNKLKTRDTSSSFQNLITEEYNNWFIQHNPHGNTTIKQIEYPYSPLISIITPVFNTDKIFLEKCIQSVLSQTYQNWELCLADDCSSKTYIKEVLNKYSKIDKRIKVIFRNKNGHISRASNSALKLASGEFIALVDHDDELWPNALSEVVKVLNTNPKIDFIYSDEDKIDANGVHVDPFFKPDWSPDLFLSTNYLCHLSIIRRKLVNKVGGFRPGFEGSQDYDLFLRVTELSNQIYHIPTILYSWRKVPGSTAAIYSSKNYANSASINALQDSLHRRNIEGFVKNGLKLGSFKINYPIFHNPKVSIIIPTKDKVSLLQKCINSIINKTNYKNYEIIVVDTGSIEPSTLKYFNSIKTNSKISILTIADNLFNYSKVNNNASTKAKGEYLLFLNNDTEVVNPQWLEELLALGQLPHVGPVGAKLLYPNKKIQHAGIELLSNGWPHHFSINYPDAESYSFPYLNYKDIIKNPSAVSGACLLISKEKFNKLGGFNESYPLEFQDVDLSIRSRQQGYFPSYTPYAVLIHHEGQTINGSQNWNRIISKFNEFHSLHRDFHSPFNPNIEKIEINTKTAVDIVNQISAQIKNYPLINSSKLAKRKILFITHLYWPSIGGGEKLFQSLAEKLSIQFDITVLTSNVTSTDNYFKPLGTPPPLAEEIMNNVRIIRANINPNNTFGNFWHRFGFKFKKLWFNYASVFFGPFFDYKTIHKLLNEQWDWVICGPTPTSALFYGWMFKKITHTKLAVIPCMHTEDKLHAASINISFIKKADLVLTLTENEINFFKLHGFSQKQLLNTGLGVDEFLLNTPSKSFFEKNYVLYLGQEGGHKNILTLIDAMVSLWAKGFTNKLVIAGARTSYSPVIDDKIKSLDPDSRSKIIRINKLEDQLKVSLLDNCLVMVNPSSYESFGIVFIEAWARQKPVIGSNVPAVNQLIKNNSDGLLFDNQDITKLARSIETLLSDRKLAKKFGTNGHQKVLKAYNWPSIIKNIINHLI